MEHVEKVASYRVWGTDHIIYGAVPLSGLVQWIKDERVTAEQWVFVEPENHWKRAADITELEALFRSKPQHGLAGNLAASRIWDRLGVKPEALRRMKGFAGMDDQQIESFVRYTEVLHSVLLKISCMAFEQLLREAPVLAVPFLLALSRSVVGRIRTLTSRYEDSVRFIRATTG